MYQIWFMVDGLYFKVEVPSTAGMDTASRVWDILDDGMKSQPADNRMLSARPMRRN